MSQNTENVPQIPDQPVAIQQREEPPIQTQQKKEIQIQPLYQEPKQQTLNQQNLLMVQENPQLEQKNDELKPQQDLRINQQNSMELNSRIQNNHRNNSLNSLSNQKVISCHCKKSKCLKMYCQCYAKGNKCRDTCKCIGCENTKNSNRDKKPDCQNDEEIQKSSDSNKKSLKPKERSCNCKKSFCLKKYCECFNANQACTQACKCEECKNNGQNNSFREDKNQSSIPVIDNTFYPLTINKQVSEGFSDNGFYDKKQDPPCPKKRQKLDQDEIQTKISQILKLVPQQNYQTMLDFLAYYLS